MVQINFFIKKTASVTRANRFAGCTIKTENMSNQELALKLHKPIIRKFEKRKVESSYIDNIWGAGLAAIQLISEFSKGICFLLCIIDIISKHAFVVPLKDKKNITITNAFQKFKV